MKDGVVLYQRLLCPLPTRQSVTILKVHWAAHAAAHYIHPLWYRSAIGRFANWIAANGVVFLPTAVENWLRRWLYSAPLALGGAGNGTSALLSVCAKRRNSHDLGDHSPDGERFPLLMSAETRESVNTCTS